MMSRPDVPDAGAPARPLLRWQAGRLALGLLAVTAISGAALVPLWDPGAPRASTEALSGGLPWGWWIRGVHAWAALGFLLATVAHLAEAVARRAWTRVSPGAWWRAVALLPLALAAMIGGFTMRGDAPATAALAVWRGVLDAVPLAGPLLSVLLLGPPGAGAGTVALHHAGTLTLAAWLLSIEHGKRAWPDPAALALAFLASAAVAGLWPPGLEGPAAGGGLVRGPWYLWGLQGWLMDLPTAAGWVLPLAGILALGFLAHAGPAARRATLVLLLVLAAAWMAGTVRLLAAGGTG